MSEIVSLQDARKEQAANLGQQAPKGFRQKTKAQLLREQMQLESAQREQGRLQAMARWYAASRPVVMDIYNVLGFPMHKDASEKATQIVAALLGLAAQLVANDKSEAEPLVEAFRGLCKHEKERIEADDLNVKNQKMAAVVAALITDPELAKTEGVASPKAALEEPWLGFVDLLLEGQTETRQEREDAAFTYFRDVKIGDELAATFLRAGLDRMKGLMAEERLDGWKSIVPELLREKAATAPVATPVIERLPVDDEIEEHEEEPDESDARVS